MLSHTQVMHLFSNRDLYGTLVRDPDFVCLREKQQNIAISTVKYMTNVFFTQHLNALPIPCCVCCRSLDRGIRH